MKKNKYLFSLVMMITLFILNINVVQAEMEADLDIEQDIQDIAAESYSSLDTSQLTSEALLLMDLQTGTILYSKNEHKILYPASITKVMTALLALESGRLDELATTSSLARHAQGSRIYLEEGEEMELEKLLYGIMLNSGNDAAIVIAEHVADSEEDFAEMMTQRAKELGAINTNFANSHGLHDDNHYTTAMDIAKIARHAMKNELFSEIVRTKTLPWFAEWHSMLMNTNRLLWDYEGASGIKTGYTRQAQNTLVTTATRGDMELLAVLLKVEGRNNLFSEAQELFNYGFDHYERVKLYSAGDRLQADIFGSSQELIIAEDVYITTNKYMDDELHQELVVNHSNPFNISFRAGTRVGTLKLYTKDQLVVEASLLLAEDITLAKENVIRVAALEEGATMEEVSSANVYESLVIANKYIGVLFLALLIIGLYMWRNKKINIYR